MNEPKIERAVFAYFVIIVICVLSLLLLSGCASYKINEDGSVQTAGFFRNLRVSKKYYESGAIMTEEIVSESTTRDVLLGADQLLDTAVDTASKLKP